MIFPIVAETEDQSKKLLLNETNEIFATKRSCYLSILSKMMKELRNEMHSKHWYLKMPSFRMNTVVF